MRKVFTIGASVLTSVNLQVRMEQGRAQPSTYPIHLEATRAMVERPQWVGINVSKSSLDVVEGGDLLVGEGILDH